MCSYLYSTGRVFGRTEWGGMMKGIYSCPECGGHYWEDYYIDTVPQYAICKKCEFKQTPEVP